MFKNYYYLLGIPAESSDDEIRAAIERLQGKRSKSLLEEARMILLNKRLRELYDSEFEQYSISENKSEYIVKNVDLEKELKKIEVYQERNAELSNKDIYAREEKSNSFRRSIKWFVIGTIVLSLIKCTASCLYRSPYYYY